MEKTIEQKKIFEKIERTAQNEYDRKKELEEQLKKLKEKEKLQKMILKGLIILAAIILALLQKVFPEVTQKFLIDDEWKTLLVVILGILTILTKKLTGIEIFEKIKETSDELDYANIEDESDILKAEKQFKLHQNELQKYYTQNLSHSHKIFVTGIICIMLGFGIIVYTLNVLSTQQNINNGMELMLTGGIGGVLLNFIGVVYLKMYSETLRVLTEFHNKLVYTHNLHFSNYLLAKVETKEMKEKILHEAILKIVTKEKDI